MNPKYTVLFKWEVLDRLKSYLQKNLSPISNLSLIFPTDLSESNLLKLSKNADVIVGWRPTEKLLLNATKLKLFINPGVGVQHLIPIFRSLDPTRKIVLINGHGNTFFTAQHAVSLLLSLTNRIIPHHEWMKQGKWRTGDDEAKSIPLRNKTIGLLGYGHINQQVHQLLSSFPVNFAILRQSWDNPLFFTALPTDFERYTPEMMDDFLKATDFLIVAVPQTDKTTNLLRAHELEQLGPESFVINISRGPVINEEDFFHALKSNIIAGAAIDVWYEYHPNPDDEGKKFPYHFPFHHLPQVILSPHRAASPFDDLKRWDEVIENLSRLAKGRTDFLNVVDLTKEY